MPTNTVSVYMPHQETSEENCLACPSFKAWPRMPGRKEKGECCYGREEETEFAGPYGEPLCEKQEEAQARPTQVVTQEKPEAFNSMVTAFRKALT